MLLPLFIPLHAPRSIASFELKRESRETLARAARDNSLDSSIHRRAPPRLLLHPAGEIGRGREGKGGEGRGYRAGNRIVNRGVLRAIYARTRDEPEGGKEREKERKRRKKARDAQACLPCERQHNGVM